MATAPPNASPRDARPPDAGSRPLAAGTPAPGFTLHVAPDRTVTLAALRGQPVILAFYPADWSPVCGDQIALYNEVREAFDAYGAHLLGISVDSVWCHQAFTEARHLHFPLLADFHPKGAVSRVYGAYREEDGFSERALFVLDAEGVVRWSYVSPVGENPGADGILAALDALTPEQRGAPRGGEEAGGQRAAARPDVPSDTLAAQTSHAAQTAETRP